MALAIQQELITPKVSPSNLTETSDINGAVIAVGTVVRSFDFPFAFDDGRLAGFGLNDVRTSFIRGVVEAIGETRMEGCPRYTIRVLSTHRAGHTELAVSTKRSGEQILPPLNGIRSLIGGRCCGVVVDPNQEIEVNYPEHQRSVAF